MTVAAVICRTSEKLQVACKSSAGADRSATCLLCKCPLDTVVGEQQKFYTHTHVYVCVYIVYIFVYMDMYIYFFGKFLTYSP